MGERAGGSGFPPAFSFVDTRQQIRYTGIMKTLILAVIIATAAVSSAQVPPCPGACPTDADLKYWAAKAAQAREDAKEAARLEAAVRIAEARAAARNSRDDDAAYQMLQLRIVSAYPNNPAMWQYLNRNPQQIPKYLGER